MLKDLIAQAQYVPRALLLTALITAAGLFCMDGGREKWMIGNIVKYRRVILFVFYLSFLLTCAVFARGRTYPLSSVMRNFGFRRNDAAWNREIIENILIFTPYTFIFLWAFRPGKPWKAALILSAVTTCVIELSQLVMWLGYFQLADIVHNVLGGMIGCAAWVAFRFCAEKLRGFGKKPRE